MFGTGAVYERLFPRWKPDPRLRPTHSNAVRTGGAVTIRWLGTAGHLIETERTTLLIDPFLSRPNLLTVATARLAPDEGAIRKQLPANVDAVVCGHSHFDHLLDAPFIAKVSGASLIGSHTTCVFARASGVPESQLVVVPPEGREVPVGDLVVRLVRSRHGRIFPVGVPFPGEVRVPPRLPARLWHYRMGGAFGILVRAGATTIYHNGSADLVDAELEGARADVLLVGLAGRQSTRGYLKRLVTSLRPSLILPTHHDSFFGPLEDGVRLLPRIDLSGFAREVRGLAPRATIITPGYFEPTVVPPDDSRAAVIAS